MHTWFLDSSPTWIYNIQFINIHRKIKIRPKEIKNREKIRFLYLNQIDPESSRNDITRAINRKKKKNTNLALVSSDLRPKGRGRPQRILLGVWPDEHIRGVIRAVVFRDGHSPHMVKEEPTMYPGLANYAACNGPEGAVSPGAAAAAAVAAVAQGNNDFPFLSPVETQQQY